MKKIYTLIVTIAAVVLVAASCTTEDFNKKYLDPSKTTTATCDKLMTGTFIAGNQNTFNSYWRMYTWDNYFGKLAQTIGFSNNSGTVYYINDGYANDRWNNFYDILRNFRVLENVLSKEAEDEQAQDVIFKDLAEIFMIDHLSQIVDIWGPVPFTQACYLGVNGDYANSFAPYDSDEELYAYMLERLDAIYSEVSSYKSGISSVIQAKLNKQDYICGGDLDLWLRYCNTLLLRLGVHVSAQGALTSTGKEAVAKAAARPLVNNLENSIEVKSDNDGFKYWENFRDGYKDINNTASQVIIDALQITGANDPRLPVIYVPTLNDYNGGDGIDDPNYTAGEYFGRSTYETNAQQSARSGSAHNTEATRYYARLNGKTFTYNNYMVSPIISAAEAWFLLAEAYQKSYASGNAKTAFVNGVKYSILAYYKSNIESVHSLAMSSEQADDFQATEYPSDTEIETFANNYWDAYADKMEAIMTQKWVHFGILQATQAWTDIRRTGYPNLYYPEDGADNNGYKTIPQRVKYPNSDATSNAANYKVAADATNNDSAYYTLFWAQSLK
jgi:hypothetical protein